MTARRLIAPGGGPVAWLGGLVLAYLTVPVVAFVARLAESHQRGFTQPGLFRALWVSCESASISLAIVALLGIPLAYALARSRSRWAGVLGGAVYLPLAVPPLMSGILLIYLVGPYAYLGRMFGGRLTDSLVGVVLAQTFVSAPFLIVAARSAFASEDPAFDEAAAGLGHRRVARFFKVAIPLASTGIRAGLLLAWLRAFGEYGATVLLAYHPTSLPVYTYTEFSGSGLAQTEAPTALALAVAVIAVTLGRARLSRRRAPGPPLAEPAMPVARAPTVVRFELGVDLGSFVLRCSHSSRTHRLAVLGPSGSGKSLTLRSLAGFFGPGAGRVWFGEDEVGTVPVESRHVGYVPQGYQLLPHLDTWSQVRFGERADPGLAAYWLDTLRIAHLAGRRPDEMSGGQRQRVCLAQALARDPRLLLLDEPFSALDAPVRSELGIELRRLQRACGLSTVLVTHDPEEAALLADEILVLFDGSAVQSGTLAELLASPATPEVARLLGASNVLRGRAGSTGELCAPGITIDGAAAGLAPGCPLTWCVHPDRVLVSSSGSWAAVILDAAHLGAAVLLELRLAGGLVLRARAPLGRDWGAGDTCSVTIPNGAVTVWPQLHRSAATNLEEPAEQRGVGGHRIGRGLRSRLRSLA